MPERDMQAAVVYLQRNPEANVYTSAKGKGRRGNPPGPDGKTLESWNSGFTEHLRSECPKTGPDDTMSHFAGGRSTPPHFIFVESEPDESS